MPNAQDLQSLISHAGIPKGFARLVGATYPDLKRMAGHLYKRERVQDSLRPTGLVHLAYVRVASHLPPKYDNPGHYFGTMAQSMKQILLDRGRRRGTAKRGGGMDPVPLQGLSLVAPEYKDFGDLHEALERLRSRDPCLAGIVDLLFFEGYTAVEAAEKLGMGESTIRAYWSLARRQLRDYLEKH